MPEFDDDFEDDDDYPTEPSQDSRLVRDLRKQVKELSKANKVKESELTTLRNSVRERTVAEVLSSKGINPKVAKFIPTDIETTPESIAEWINDYADVFGITQAKPEPEQQEASPQAQTHERMRAAEEGGQSSTGEMALQQRLASAGNAAELTEIMAQYGRTAV